MYTGSCTKPECRCIKREDKIDSFGCKRQKALHNPKPKFWPKWSDEEHSGTAGFADLALVSHSLKRQSPPLPTLGEAGVTEPPLHHPWEAWAVAASSLLWGGLRHNYLDATFSKRPGNSTQWGIKTCALQKRANNLFKMENHSVYPFLSTQEEEIFPLLFGNWKILKNTFLESGSEHRVIKAVLVLQHISKPPSFCPPCPGPILPAFLKLLLVYTAKKPWSGFTLKKIYWSQMST